MTTQDELLKAAAAAAIGALTKAAVEPALSAGRKVWDWAKGQTPAAEAPLLAVVEAAPEKPGAPGMLEAVLRNRLAEQPGAANDLRRLLGNEAAAFAVLQTANVTGDHNFTPQISGSGNVVVGGRSLGVAPTRPWPRG